MSIPLSHIPFLREILKTIRTSESHSANIEALTTKLNMDMDEAQQQLVAIEPYFRSVLRGDDRVISLAQPLPAAFDAAE